MNYLLLTGISSNSDLKSIVSEYALGKIKAEKLIQIYEWIKENDKDNDLDFMKINLGTSPINEKISRNFTEYIQIDEKQEQPNDAPKQLVEKQKYKKKITKRI
jgi:hypothetical protein